MNQTKCCECDTNIKFENNKQFIQCPNCKICLSLNYFNVKIDLRIWLILTGLLALIFYEIWYIVPILSAVLGFTLLAKGTLINYKTSKVSDNYCNDETKNSS